MDNKLLEEFDCEKQCEYKGRIYKVRDNGAICRLSKEGCRISKWDNVWTFGKKNPNGYMIHANNVRVHQVVCTAFHGPEPYPNMVVDHKDTNRCNNRPENLRWQTRFENALNNPITCKKIIYLCGSKEAFLENPAILREKSLPMNVEWMRPVTKEEAAICKKNMDWWSLRDSKPSTGKGFGDYVFSTDITKEATKWNGTFLYHNNEDRDKEEVYSTEYKNVKETLNIIESLTPRAKQQDWETPTEFPQCPQEITSTPLQDYLKRLKEGVVYSKNKYVISYVLDAAMSEDETHLSVIVKTDGIKPYALSEVIYEDGIFIHKSKGRFFEEVGAIKYFTKSLGREWSGGDVLDDNC